MGFQAIVNGEGIPKHFVNELGGPEGPPHPILKHQEGITPALLRSGVGAGAGLICAMMRIP
jgi:hypothetical protein